LWHGAREKWSIYRAPHLTHGKSLVVTAIFGQFAVRLPHGRTAN
jgi:hypothetical protein